MEVLQRRSSAQRSPRQRRWRFAETSRKDPCRRRRRRLWQLHHCLYLCQERHDRGHRTIFPICAERSPSCEDLGLRDKMDREEPDHERNQEETKEQKDRSAKSCNPAGQSQIFLQFLQVNRPDRSQPQPLGSQLGRNETKRRPWNWLRNCRRHCWWSPPLQFGVLSGHLTRRRLKLRRLRRWRWWRLGWWRRSWQEKKEREVRFEVKEQVKGQGQEVSRKDLRKTWVQKPMIPNLPTLHTLLPIKTTSV